MENYLDIAINAVKSASKVCKQIQHNLVTDDTLIKKDKSPVTVADFASQTVICSILNKHFPEIPVVGEESAGELRSAENRPLLEKIAAYLPGWQTGDIVDAIDIGNGSPDKLFWTLDPIDGTKGFLRGEQYAVALALIQNGEIILGVLGCPNLSPDEKNDDGSIVYAVRNGGAFIRPLEGGEIRKIHVTQNEHGNDVRFLESVEAAHANHGLQGQIMTFFGEHAKSVRIDSQVKYAVLAQGKADVYLRLPNSEKPDYREKIWDHAAGAAIVSEAGGKITDMNGKPLNFNLGRKMVENQGVIVTNGFLHDSVISIIQKSQTG